MQSGSAPIKHDQLILLLLESAVKWLYITNWGNFFSFCHNIFGDANDFTKSVEISVCLF